MFPCAQPHPLGFGTVQLGTRSDLVLTVHGKDGRERFVGGNDDRGVVGISVDPQFLCGIGQMDASNSRGSP